MATIFVVRRYNTDRSFEEYLITEKEYRDLGNENASAPPNKSALGSRSYTDLEWKSLWEIHQDTGIVIGKDADGKDVTKTLVRMVAFETTDDPDSAEKHP